MTKQISLVIGLIFSATVITAQKNVLVLMADDFNRWTGMNSYYPYSESQTPNIDALAEKGCLRRATTLGLEGVSLVTKVTANGRLLFSIRRLVSGAGSDTSRVDLMAALRLISNSTSSLRPFGRRFSRLSPIWSTSSVDWSSRLGSPIAC